MVLLLLLLLLSCNCPILVLNKVYYYYYYYYYKNYTAKIYNQTFISDDLGYSLNLYETYRKTTSTFDRFKVCTQN